MSTETAHIRGISNVDNCDCGFDVLEEYIFRDARGSRIFWHKKQPCMPSNHPIKAASSSSSTPYSGTLVFCGAVQ